ncbi:MAG: oxidoreductase, partial [Pseudonocardiales bacterium]|nr:oxidoreductase [Pseudonocardiales bacterium]
MTLLGVGLIGAGSVARGIHVPTLGRLADYFKIVHIADADPVVGAMLAERTGAAFSESFRDLLADEAVQVVAVCSPDGVHAEHVVAACAAGKQAVLCEKPLATSREEATQITEAARISGTHIVVGAMHVYDPAWVDVSPECG